MGTSLVVQWLKHRASTVGGAGLIPGRGTKIVHAKKRKEKKKKLYDSIESLFVHFNLNYADLDKVGF